MRSHCLVAVLVTLVLIDVGDGHGYPRRHRYNSQQRIIRKCLKSPIVIEIVTRFTCPKPDPCATVDCNCNGRCVDGTCQCNTGFQGEFCTEPTLVCQAGGELIVVDGQAQCECMEGTFGVDCSIKYCETEESNPCKNGGTCVQAEIVTEFPSCTCPINTVQPVCSDDPCIIDPGVCINGGVCRPGVREGLKFCLCLNFFAGNFCEIDNRPAGASILK